LSLRIDPENMTFWTKPTDTQPLSRPKRGSGPKWDPWGSHQRPK